MMQMLPTKRWIRITLGVVLGPALLFGVLSVLFPLPTKRLHPPASAVMLDRDGGLMRAFLAPDEMWRITVDASEVSPALREAVLAYEDKRFYWHPGVDPVAVLRATVANVRAGRVVQGGSTLTMQVARMMDPKARTLKNKMVEAFRALQLEWRYSKEEILSLYFNWAPYGGNIVGVGAASYFYFDKHPRQLSLGEAALLAAIPNNPNRYRPDVNTEAARQARDKVLALLADGGLFSAEAANEARTEPVPRQRYALPFRAPHLASYLKQHHIGAERLETTLDASLQETAERLLRAHVKPLGGQGIHNGAVVVIDNKTQAVRALIGSASFFNEQHAGQVNGAMAPRSPGSALKPFIYALGVEQGRITPKSLLEDIPVDYAGYTPENYDRTYRGMVSAEEALILSLNVPAVNLAADLGGGQGIYQFLKAAGLSTLTEPWHHYGLSLILGGGEVTLLELTNLYAGLANGGMFKPYRLLASDPQDAGKPLLDEETAFLITDILSRLRRPELPAVWEWSQNMPKVAWKTGTSYGHRDAWSIGYTPRFTIGVWIGNMDGKGAPAMVGAEVAAPLLFDLFNAIETNPADRWFIRPPGLSRRRICAVSGQPATAFCPSVHEEWYRPGHAPIQPCTIHELILVDQATGHRLCSHCRLGRAYHEEVVEHWPARLAAFLTRTGYPIDEIPAHLPSCTRLAVGESPVIHSPLPEAVYRLRKGVPADHQRILLNASVSNQTETLYWFVDGEMIYSGAPSGRIFMTPSVGTHTVLCMDDEGRSSQVTITID